MGLNKTQWKGLSERTGAHLTARNGFQGLCLTRSHGIYFFIITDKYMHCSGCPNKGLFISAHSLKSIDQIDGASISSSAKGIDPSSSENVVTHKIEYRNGDIATIEQKYCSMYNFEVTYQIKQLTKESFTAALNNIDRLIPKVKQDYRLVAPLEMIIAREMSEHQLSIESEFTRSLPEMVARSNSSIEHFLRFQPATNDSAAKVTFYFGIGGH